jgi:hypothetical protein
MTYDDFEGRSLPDLVERVKINLRTQQIDFFAYEGTGSPTQPLYLKSRYLKPECPTYAQQRALDERLRQLPGMDLSGFGPSRISCESIITSAGLDVEEFDRRWTAGNDLTQVYDPQPPSFDIVGER